MGTRSLNGELSIVMFDYRRVWVFLVDVPEKKHMGTTATKTGTCGGTNIASPMAVNSS